MSVFYDHLINLEELHQELLDFNFAVREHYQLLQLADSTLHHEIVGVCLDCLPTEHHEYFLVRFKEQPDDPSILVFLKEKEPDIENKIRSKSTEVKERIRKDLRKVKTKHS